MTSLRTLDRSDDRTTVRLEPGDHVDVRLESPGATGFMWAVVRAPGCVRAIDDDLDADLDRAGAAGVHRFRFAAVHPGEGELRLELRRPWDSADLEPDDRYSVTLEVVHPTPASAADA